MVPGSADIENRFCLAAVLAQALLVVGNRFHHVATVYEKKQRGAGLVANYNITPVALDDHAVSRLVYILSDKLFTNAWIIPAEISRSVTSASTVCTPVISVPGTTAGCG